MSENRIIQCDYDELTSLAGQFAQEADQASQMIQQIRNCVDDLQAGGWIGRGADKFYTEMEDLIFPALQRLVQALEEAGSGINKIGGLFSDAEQAASQKILVSASAEAVPTGPQLGAAVTSGAGPGLAADPSSLHGATPLPIPKPASS